VGHTCPMAAAKSTMAAMERLRKICLALPEAEEKPFGGHTAPAFRVRDKLFVMTSEDGTAMNCKGAPGVQQALVASAPDRFFVPKYTGKDGWVGARLDVDEAGTSSRTRRGELAHDGPQEGRQGPCRYGVVKVTLHV